MSKKRLIDQIRAARRRLVMIGALGALLIGCVAGIGVLAFGVWCDLVWDLPAAGRIATLMIAGAAAVGFFLWLVILTLLQSGERALARSLDRAACSQGETLTGISLVRREGTFSEPLTDGLAELAIGTAADVAGRAKLAEAVPARPAIRSGLIMLAVAAVVGALFLTFPDAAMTQWRRFLTFSDEETPPPYSRIRFDVEPKGVTVRYGEEFDVSATVSGGLVDQVELVLTNQDGTQETLPMFSARENVWQTTVARVTQPADYFVRSRRARSEKYHLDVIMVPRIEEVRARVEWPAYTNRAPYEGPVPKGGIAGPIGTKVTLRAKSNRPLGEKSHVTLNLLDGSEVHPMKPNPEQTNEVTGQFEITDDGNFEIRLVDVAGNESSDVYRATITILSDTRPFVRLLQPREQSFATPTITIAVDISATDDFGVSGLWLYRSLNDSRPLPYAVPFGSVRPNVRQVVELPLAEYGVKPGDVIRLFARVEDNNPKGAQGSESRVVEITIISQEQYEEYLRARKGVQLLTEKYNQIARRMERLEADLKKLQKELDDLKAGRKGEKGEKGKKDGQKSPKGQLTEKQIREKLEKIKKRLEQEIKAMQKLADNPLPYDLEETLNEALKKQIERLEKLQAANGKMMFKPSLTEKDLEEHIKKMLESLGKDRKKMQQAMKPLKWIEAVMPLLIDQERFVQLVKKQKDLAKRAKALKGKDNPDDPQLKVRMQELAEEQKQIEEDLEKLIDDIFLHEANLPDDPELDNLRLSALGFAESVRQSGVSKVLQASADALTKFQGTTGAKKSQEAADILEKFLSKCKGIGNSACNCPPCFRPSMCQMKNTMQQLLDQMKMGGGGGYGMLGANSRPAGLYGQMPGMTGRDDRMEGMHGDPIHGYRNSGNPDDDTWSDIEAEGTTSNNAEVTVPVRYQRRVGNYFQRILEEFHEEQ